MQSSSLWCRNIANHHPHKAKIYRCNLLLYGAETLSTANSINQHGEQNQQMEVEMIWARIKDRYGKHCKDGHQRGKAKLEEQMNLQTDNKEGAEE